MFVQFDHYTVRKQNYMYFMSLWNPTGRTSCYSSVVQPKQQYYRGCLSLSKHLQGLRMTSRPVFTNKVQIGLSNPIMWLLFHKGSLRPGAGLRFEHCLFCVCLCVSCLPLWIRSSHLIDWKLKICKRYSNACPLWNICPLRTVQF